MRILFLNDSAQRDSVACSAQAFVRNYDASTVSQFEAVYEKLTGRSTLRTSNTSCEVELAKS
jgi:hypothetical protein